jgi:hypothetical protein
MKPPIGTIALLVCFLHAAAAQAQVSFTMVDVTPSVIPIVNAWKTASGTNWVWGVTTPDIDGDGDSDLIITSHNGVTAGQYASIILRNDYIAPGVHTFVDVTETVLPNPAVSWYENKPQPLDIDNDGDQDILSGDQGQVCINTGGVLTPTGQQIRGTDRDTVFGDFNSDGLPDFFIDQREYSVTTRKTYLGTTSKIFTETLTILPLRPGDALFATLPATVQTKLANSIAAANTTTEFNRYHGPTIVDDLDINNDGRIDTLISFNGSYNTGDYWFSLLLQDASGTLVESNTAVGLPMAGVSMVSVEDVNADGFYDFLIARGGNSAGLYIQTANGQFVKGATSLTNYLKLDSPYTPHETWEDFDQDGDKDLVISMLRLRHFKVYEQTGLNSCNFVERLFDNHWDADGMQVRTRSGVAADFNGDGMTDIVNIGGSTANAATSPCRLWINNTPPVNPPDPPTQALLDNQAARTRFNTVRPPVEAESTTLQGQPVSPERDAALEVNTEKLNRASDALEGIEPVTMTLPVPQHDPESANYQRFLAAIDGPAYYNLGAYDLALAHRLSGQQKYADRAIAYANGVVAANTTAGDTYLKIGPQFRDVFATLAWCNPSQPDREKWIAWGTQHLLALWVPGRYASNAGYSNYFHSFITATSYYAMATGDEEWLTFLKENRLPLLKAYYETTPGGGSSEGTGYYESHFKLNDLALLWRAYDGTEILPREFIDGSILYLVSATCPGYTEICPIGDQARAKGRVDGYHRLLALSALKVAGTDSPNAPYAREYLAKGPKPDQKFHYQFELADYETGSKLPPPLEYHAQGVGHYFARTEKGDLFYVVCGRKEGDHSASDQGSFGWWSDGRWKSVTQNRWTKNGINRGSYWQNVLLFLQNGKAIEQGYGTSLLTVADECGDLVFRCDLSPVYDQRKVASWQRTLTWDRGKQLEIEDRFALAPGVTALQQLQMARDDVYIDTAQSHTWADWRTKEVDPTQQSTGGWRIQVAINSGDVTVVR